jgi:hypothetical protein
MKETGMVKGSEDDFRALKEDHYARLFKIHKLLVTKERDFTGTFDTDTVGLCTHFLHPKNDAGEKGSDAKLPKLRAGDRILGNDPGRANLCCMAEKTANGKFRYFRLTRGQYNSESCIERAKKWKQRGHAGIRPHLNALSEVSSMGADWEKHEAFLAVHATHWRVLLHENLKKRWARQRLRLYGGKKRTLAEFFGRIRKGGHRGPGPGRPHIHRLRRRPQADGVGREGGGVREVCRIQE